VILAGQCLWGGYVFDLWFMGLIDVRVLLGRRFMNELSTAASS
jgi:hypothetical protein